MVNTRIDVAAAVGTNTLLGKIMGQAHFPILLGAILQTPPDTIVYIDFAGVTNLTASYIAATIVQLLRLLASGSLERYLVIGGVHEDYYHEIEYVLNHEHTPALLRTTTGTIRVLGPLDNAYAQTLDAVTQRGSVTAKELQHTTTARIGQTGWIKRLTTLHAQGLVRRTRIGREYTYEPITTEETNG